jgi:sterol desaturase/sphingolipid hydroxylase (fatty acid hydroxylase superfamily)
MRSFELDERCREAALHGVSARAPRVPFFRHPWVDRLLSTSHPATPYLMFMPICAWLVMRAFAAGVDATEITALFGGGAFAWTFVEYLMHRFGLHLPTKTPSFRIAFYLVHGHHHEAPDDTRRIVATPLQGALLALLLAGIARLVAGPIASGPLLAGALVGYQLYELAHWSAHHARTRIWPLGALRRHHLAHHHVDAKSRFGISSPLWDVVFGTRGTSQRASPRRTA